LEKSTASWARMYKLFAKINIQGLSGSGILGVYGILIPKHEVECPTCMGGVFVDTLFHAHRSRVHNMTKQINFPIIWGEVMNGQSGQVA
jgi:hypothetical protein